MDPVSLAGSVFVVISLVVSVYKAIISYITDVGRLAERYTIVEIIALQLGSKSVLQMQSRVLEDLDTDLDTDTDSKLAMDFKKVTQDESQMVTIAVGQCVK